MDQEVRAVTVRTASVRLPNGTVRVDVKSRAPGWHLEDLCDFAARDNAKRGFLVVSKVLGRHIPVRPSVMRRTFHSLAEQLLPDLPGPVLFVGMAETAVALGQGVFEEYLLRTGRTDCVYLHSTRNHVFGAQLWVQFSEPHSHATDHLIYVPERAEDRWLASAARSLVLVDDEISTGTTLRNLSEALLRVTRAEQTHYVCLTDWSGGAGSSGPETARHALLTGSLSWQGESTPSLQKPRASNSSLGVALNCWNFGRRGIGRALHPGDLDIEVNYGALHFRHRVLVLGSGEFVYPPFRVAEAMERAGRDVWCQSTSRTPVVAGGAMSGDSVRLEDPYGSSADYFLHNPRACAPDYIMYLHETPECSTEPLQGIARTVTARMRGMQ